MTPGSTPKRESPAQKQPMPKVASLPLISFSCSGILLNGQILLRSKMFGHVKCVPHWYDEMEQLSAKTVRTKHGNITVIMWCDRNIFDDFGFVWYAAHFHGLDATLCNASTVACVKPVSRTSDIGSGPSGPRDELVALAPESPEWRTSGRVRERGTRTCWMSTIARKRQGGGLSCGVHVWRMKVKEDQFPVCSTD